MKILFINKSVSGPMEQLGNFIGGLEDYSSVFMAERWARDAQLSIGATVRIPTISIDKCVSDNLPVAASTVENMMLRNVSNAANVKLACQRLAQHGFVPDVIYATAQDGYAMDVREVFPTARMAVRLDWVYPQKSLDIFSESAGEHDIAFEKVYNGFLNTLLAESTVGITASHWQKGLIEENLKNKIHVVNNGVDTHFFTPSSVKIKDETITFSCHGKSPLRGAHVVFACLPQLLSLRPTCMVNIVSFAARKSCGGKGRHVRELSALLPPLTDEQRQRVNIICSPPLGVYRALLQHSMLYVYLTAPNTLSAGIMEAMSCGALVFASATEAVREIITHEENGLLWEGNDAQDLAFQVAELCCMSKALSGLRANARSSIVEKHNLRELLQYHAQVVLGA